METKRCARTWLASLTWMSVYMMYELSCRGRWEWGGGGRGEGGGGTYSALNCCKCKGNK